MGIIVFNVNDSYSVSLRMVMSCKFLIKSGYTATNSTKNSRDVFIIKFCRALAVKETLFASLTILLAFFISHNSHADQLHQNDIEKQNEGFMCAQVYPCDSEGNILKELISDPSSPCLAYYLSICKKAQLKKQEFSCTDQKEELKKLQKENRSLKSKLNRLIKSSKRK